MAETLYDALLTDAMGGPYKTDPQMVAFAHAIRAGTRLVLDHAAMVPFYGALDSQADAILDLMAAEMRTPYYESTYSADVKRALIRNTERWYQTSGTLAAVEELGETVFGECKVEEWYEYDGDPYNFRVITNMLASPDIIQDFRKIIRYIKNVRSHLEAVAIHRTIDTRGSHAAKTAFSVTYPLPIRCI